MSKLGFHVSSGNRTGLGECLAKCAEAGSPVPVIFTVDQDMWPDVQQHSPTTVVVFRTQKNAKSQEIGDGPGDCYHGNPVQSARDWINAMMPVWRKNRAQYYAPINEQDAATLADFKWLDDFSVECMKVAEANGFKLALYAFSGGNPKDVSQPAIGQPYKLEDAWQELLPSMQMAKANGHIQLLHEYGFENEDNPEGRLRTSAPNLATRYRRSYRYLQSFNADPPLVISEASAGVGGWSGIGMGAWLADAKWYDGELMKDRIVMGCCLYQVGGAENIRLALPSLADYISETPNPAPESGDLPVMLTDITRTGERVTPATPTGGGKGTPTGDDKGTPTDDGKGTSTGGDEETPPPTSGPLDFEVSVMDNRKDPDRPNGIILTFKIEATGGSGHYLYMCEGQTLPGPIRERPSTRTGKIIEAYRVTSSDGQTLQKKCFFSPDQFPPAHG